MPVALQHAAALSSAAGHGAGRRRRRAETATRRAAASRSQALAMAAISIADFVPSRKELNICGFMPAARGLFRRQAVMRPDVVRRHLVIGGQILRALAGRDHGEAAGARPVHHLGDEGRLVAIGHGSRPRPPTRASAASSGPASTSASTLTMTMCLPLRIAARAWAMPAAGLPGRLDDDFDIVVGRQGRRRHRGSASCRYGPRPSPRLEQARLRPFGIEIGDRGHLQPRACQGPGRGTWSRTCPRRSARPAPAVPRRPALEEFMEIHVRPAAIRGFTIFRLQPLSV